MPKLKEPGQSRNLENCQPGASQDEVMGALKKVATSPKPPA